MVAKRANPNQERKDNIITPNNNLLEQQNKRKETKQGPKSTKTSNQKKPCHHQLRESPLISHNKVRKNELESNRAKPTCHGGDDTPKRTFKYTILDCLTREHFT